jgi:hypothetical protein
MKLLHLRTSATLSPAHNPTVRILVRQLLQALTSTDEALRQAAVRRLLGNHPPPVISHIISQLAERLKSRSERVSRQAGLSLAEIGPRAMPALLGLLLRSRSVPGRVRAAPVLAVIGVTLDPEPRADLLVNLFTLWHTVRDPAVAQALDRAFSTLQAVSRRW